MRSLQNDHKNRLKAQFSHLIETELQFKRAFIAHPFMLNRLFIEHESFFDSSFSVFSSRFLNHLFLFPSFLVNALWMGKTEQNAPFVMGMRENGYCPQKCVIHLSIVSLFFPFFFV